MSETAGLRFAAPQLIEFADKLLWLKGGKCASCGKLSFPYSAICWHCQSERMETARLARKGKLYSYSVVHAAAKGWRVPYVLGYVDLEDGIRVLSHIDAEQGQLRCDLPVRLALGVIRHDADGVAVHSHVFEPDTGAA